MTANPNFDMEDASSPVQLALLTAPNTTDLATGFAAVYEQMAQSVKVDALIRIHATGSQTNGHRGALLFDYAKRAIALRESSAIDELARSVAFLFPGLGDHYIGMGLDLYRALPIFRNEVDRCAELLRPELGVDIRTVMHPSGTHDDAAQASPKGGLDLRRMLGRDGRAPTPDEARLNETPNAQPALFVIEYALAKQWQAWGVNPASMMGYSLGEYVAACLAGVLSLEDSLTLVARRAQLIASLPAGAMLAIMLPEQEIAPLLGEHLSLSAVNGPEFCVVGGPPEEVDSLQKRLRERGTAVRRVQSSHAFHTKMMTPIADPVTRLVAGFTRHPPRIPYVSNVTGAPITAAEATDPAYWAKHLCQPVRFAEGLSALATLTARTLLEVGPGQTLSSLVPQGEGRTVLPSMRHTFDPEPDTSVLLKAVSRLWLSGAAVEWERFPQAALDPVDLPRASPSAAASSDLALSSTASANAAPPSTKTEKELAPIWRTLLKCDVATTDAHFFRLGGNSLVATRLIDRIARSFRVRFPLRRVYESPTLDAMAADIDTLRGGGALAPRARAEADKPLFQLPNGLRVAHQNEAETLHFYDDIFEHRSYVKHGIRIPDGGCVLDVGGNIGLFTVFAHGEAKDVRIFTFEPAPPLVQIIRRNVQQHGIRATVFDFGLSNRERSAPFTFYPHSAGMSSFHPDDAEERRNLKAIMDNQRKGGDAKAGEIGAHEAELLDVRFATVTFDAKLRRLSDVLREHAIERVDLMKVDVQKSELEVIEGIEEADWPKFSQIVLEAHDENGRVGALTERFERHGFTVIAEQDALYAGTNIYNIYAIRRGH
ncbi:FkbM family methyltransferase [Pendulispora albinea]|uniref:FkbM family methyltransferase n=1 Tax=Pendulispora albinea TaxID=2741071 RepID=A0ABZ2LN07_9BACT